jgi:TetR/AcrR family tetracycline transcriptional repressor
MALERSAMIAAGLKLLDEVGLEGLTLRRLASELGVQAPAIYWHFKSKQDLLDHMASTVLVAGVRGIPFNRRMRWDRWAMEYGRGLRRILLLHRDGARMISGTQLADNSLYAPMENSLLILSDAGFSSYLSIVALSTLYSYVVGFVIEEQAVCPRPNEFIDFYDPEKRAQRVDGKKFPRAQKAGGYLFTKFDRRFEDGLKLIVAGMAARKPVKAVVVKISSK